MKNLKTLPLIALCGAALGCFALLSSTSIAQAGGDSQEAPDQGESAKEQEKPKAKASGKELHDSMEQLEKHMRAMRKLMSNPEMTKEALASCAEMEQHILTSLHHSPAPHSELKDQTELEYKVEFKRRMLTVYGTVLDLEVALEKGDTDAARTAYRSLGMDRRDGHQIYISEEEQQRNRKGRGGRGGRGGRNRDGDSGGESDGDK